VGLSGEKLTREAEARERFASAIKREREFKARVQYASQKRMSIVKPARTLARVNQTPDFSLRAVIPGDNYPALCVPNLYAALSENISPLAGRKLQRHGRLSGWPGAEAAQGGKNKRSPTETVEEILFFNRLPGTQTISLYL
jgi:hypothetical protein